MSFRIVVLAAALAALVAPRAVLAQAPPAAGGQPALPKRPMLSIRSNPDHATLVLSGPAEATGQAPLEIPATYEGTYSVRVGGEGFAKTTGRIYLSPSGRPPLLVSERPGPSSGLLIRSLNFPGVPDLTSGHGGRGLVLLSAAAGAGFAATRAHLRLHERLDEPGAFAASRADDERRERNAWIGYGGAVWGLSAIDYWVRPRLDLEEASAGGATLVTPVVTRGGMVWRAILSPGAGHEYAAQSFRGEFWLGATLATGAAFVIAQQKVHDSETRAERSTAMVDSAGPNDRALALRKAQEAENHVQSALDARHALGIATVAVYAASVLDALIAPIHKHESLVAPPRPPAKVSMLLPTDPTAPRLGLLARF